MNLLLTQLQVSDSVGPFEVVSGAVDGHNSRSRQAACLSIRLVDGVVVYAGAALEGERR